MTDKYYRIVLDTGKSRQDLEKLGKVVDKTTGSVNKSQFSINKLAFAIKGVLIGGAVGIATKALINVQREFDKLNAALITVTGSTENAAVAFKAIQGLATSTPYDVQEVTEAFIRLRNMGLEPSEEAIISYGNTAAAMGRDLKDFVNAVTNATVGEFESLKTFGIKAKNEGDTIKFMFQGVATSVGNNAKEIENYLRSLGEVQFADAMENRMKTLDGAISNLEDSWNALQLVVSKGDFSEHVTKAVGTMSDAIEEITALIDSGQLEFTLKAIALNFRGFADDFVRSGNVIISAWDLITSAIADNPIDADKAEGSFFSKMVPNIRSNIQILAVETAATMDRMKANMIALGRITNSRNREELELAQQMWKEKHDLIQRNYEASLNVIQKERDADIAATEEKLKAGRIAREKWEELWSGSGGVLKKFGVEGGTEEVPTSTPEGDSSLEKMTQATALLTGLLNDRKGYWEEHGRNLLSIDRDTYGGKMAALEAYLYERRAAETAGFQEDLANINAQATAINDNEKISKEQKWMAMQELEQQELLARGNHQQALTEIEAEGEAARRAIAEREWQNRIDMAQQAAGSLMTLMQGQSKKGFEVAKGAAIGIAAVKGWEAATAAWASGMSTGGPWAPVVAAGYTAASLLKTGAQIKSLAATKYNSGSVPSAGGGGGVPTAGGGIPSTATSVNEQVNQHRSIEIKIDDDAVLLGSAVKKIFRAAQGDDELMDSWDTATGDASRRGVYA